MKIKYEMIKREIAGETYLVPVGEAARKYSGLFAMTDVAAFIWDCIPQVASTDDIVKAVLDEYEVDSETAKNDVDEFMEKLKTMGVLE